MNTRATTVSILIIGIVTGAVLLARAADRAPQGQERIGVYDSRSIVIAFVNSPCFAETEGRLLQERMAELKEAQVSRDEERIAELKAWGKARQKLRHEQGFSTAPVDDVLKHIARKLPGILEQAEVKVIVSKWDKDALAMHASAQKVDVTMMLVDAFEPTEKQRAYAIEIQKRAPLPPGQVDHEH
jgi:hypothetical protein